MKKHAYQIIVLGATKIRALKLLEEIWEENRDQMHFKITNGILMTDGTVLRAMSVSDYRYLEGMKVDEVFYDPAISFKQVLAIRHELYTRLSQSIVPQDYWWWPLEE